MTHTPVMLDEVLAALLPRDGEVYVDGTFGAGGYTQGILQSADCTVIAIDRDPGAIANAKTMAADYDGRLIAVHGAFGDALELVHAAGFRQVDGFVIDIGVSSMQIDDPARGFSFRFDGPLDMRMDPSAPSPTAADMVNGMAEDDLANLIYRYGGERASRRIARRIAQAREEEKIHTTSRLASIIRAAIPRMAKDKIDPATRTFQALRIAVNDELGELERALTAAEALLKPGGRLVVVTFHSLEDGIVKAFLYSRSGRIPSASRHMPVSDVALAPPTFTLPSRKALEAGEAEIARNPRSRSARLRAAIRTDVPGGAA